MLRVILPTWSHVLDPDGNDLKGHAAYTRQEYSNERHGGQRNSTDDADGLDVDRIRGFGPFTYLFEIVYSNFPPRVDLWKLGMGTSGALDQCSLDSGETLGMSNHGVGGGVCTEKKKKSRSMQWVKKEPDICVGVGVVEDSRTDGGGEKEGTEGTVTSSCPGASLVCFTSN